MGADERGERASREASLVNGCNDGGVERSLGFDVRGASFRPDLRQPSREFYFSRGKSSLLGGTSPCFLPCFCYAIGRTRECFAIGSNVWERKKSVNGKKNFWKFCG